MYELIIQNYLKNLTKNDLTYYALKNNINLNDQELDYIFATIKNDYKILLSNDYETVFKDVKDHLSNDNYNKVYNLFINFRKKYQNYL